MADDVAPTHGTVSSEMAKGMARGARELTGTDYAVSTTGVTGPAAGRAGLPIGTFWIGLSVKGGEDTAIEIHLDGDRDACGWSHWAVRVIPAVPITQTSRKPGGRSK